MALCPQCERDKPHFSEDGVCTSCARHNAKVEKQRQKELLAAGKLPEEEIEALQAREDAISASAKRMEQDAERLGCEVEEVFDVQQEAKRERAARERARRNLLPFIMRFNETYEPGWVHADICKRLEKFSDDVAAKKSPRLMLFMPPRHGKSEIASKTFPAWHLGHYPKHEFIACSYNAALAMDFSRKVRGLLQDPSYHSVFPTRLDPQSQSAERWNTSVGGGYVAAGVQGPITGRGCHIGVIDDPIKDRESAESETVRQSIIDWYSSTFYTRLAPGAGVVIILTRWHEGDPAGWLLDVMAEAEREAAKTGHWPEDADKWEVISYPAVALEDEPYRKQGEALHPDRYDLKALMKIKRTLLPRDWEALYMQRPVSDDGDYFTKSMIRYYDIQPSLAGLKIYAAWDLAISQKETADYTCAFVIGVDSEDNIFVLDRIHGRFTAMEIIEQMIAVQRRWQPGIQGIETGQIELTLEPFLIKRMTETGVHIKYEKLRTRGKDKATRARSIQGRMQQGRVYWPKGALWTNDAVSELMKFPLGLHDDQVDALSWLGIMLLMFAKVRQAKPKRKKGWRDRLKKLSRKRSGARSAMSS